MRPPSFPFQKVLVTGGAGFIGSNLAEHLLSEGCEVVILDNFSTGRWENLRRLRSSPRAKVIRGDVRRTEDVKRAVRGIDVLFHEAAQISVQESLKNPGLTRQVNVLGTRNVIRQAVSRGVETVVLASSAAVYGNPRGLPIRESDRLAPISPYGVSKLDAETTWFQEAAGTGVNATALRYFNVYGPRTPVNGYAGVIVKFARHIVSGEPLLIFGDGNQSRDFVHVEDVVAANLLAAREKRASGRVLNVGTGIPTSILELARIEMEVLGARNTEIRYSKPKPGDIRESYADTSSAQKILGFKPRFSLREGLRGLRNWGISK